MIQRLQERDTADADAAQEVKAVELPSGSLAEETTAVVEVTDVVKQQDADVALDDAPRQVDDASSAANAPTNGAVRPREEEPEVEQPEAKRVKMDESDTGMAQESAPETEEVKQVGDAPREELSEDEEAPWAGYQPEVETSTNRPTDMYLDTVSWLS